MGFFKGFKDFMLDYAIPIGLHFIPGIGTAAAIGLGAAYSGIKTGIETGSPVAGIGSAALSAGLGAATAGIGAAGSKVTTGTLAPTISNAGNELATRAATQSLGGVGNAGFANLGSKISQQGLGTLTNYATASPSVLQNIGATNIPSSGANYLFGSSSDYLKDVAGQRILSRPLADGSIGKLVSSPPAETSLFGKGKELFSNAKTAAFDTTFGEAVPESLDFLPEMITNRSPATIAGAGLALKTMGTPPDIPEPLPTPEAPERDFSKYGYKGPLNRGKYTYPNAQDLAYGRTTPGSYGYIGAKQGGIMKFKRGGYPIGPDGKPQTANFLPIQGIQTTPPGLPQLQQMNKPKAGPKGSSPVQTMMGAQQAMMPSQPMPAPPQTGLGPMPMPQMPGLPDIMNNAQQMISSLPRKDISTVIRGLAEGGNVPGMAQNTGQQITGQSSGIGSGVYNNPMSEEQFINSFLSIMPNNLVGNAVRELGVGEQVGQQIYQQFNDSNKKQMAEGGEVDSNQTLEENAFVLPADVVANIGDGSSPAGVSRLQQFFGINPEQYASGGVMAGGLQGPGGGMDDLIQTSIEGKQAAAVSPQEFVVPRDIVYKIGGNSYDQGSKKLYALMKNVRKAKTGKTTQPPELKQGLGQLMRTAAA